MAKMEIELPRLPTLNEYINIERGNRFEAAKLKREWTEAVAWNVKAQSVPRLKRITKFTIIWKHENKRKDFDNVEFAQKFIRDGLVMGGVVQNDGWKCFPPRTLHKHEIAKKEGSLVIIKGIK